LKWTFGHAYVPLQKCKVLFSATQLNGLHFYRVQSTVCTYVCTYSRAHIFLSTLSVRTYIRRDVHLRILRTNPQIGLAIYYIYFTARNISSVLLHKSGSTQMDVFVKIMCSASAGWARKHFAVRRHPRR
jgi:hypothetical protein